MAILKQIWPFFVANRLLDRNASHTRVLNCGTIFPQKSKHPKCMKYSKNVSATSAVNASSLSPAMIYIILICTLGSIVNKII